MKTALITGASGGLGLEFAKIFAKENYNLVLVARSADKLKEIKKELEEAFKINVLVITQDLSENNAAETLFKTLENKEINVLINNAGFTTHGRFDQVPLKIEMDELMLNVVFLTAITKLILKDMVARGEGKILNVSSTAAFQPGPLMAVYYATKTFVLSFSEALSEELKGTGVSVTGLCPGPTDTGFAKRGGVENTILFNTGLMSPQRVAKIGYKALMSGKRVVIPGLKNNITSFLLKHTPHSMTLSAVEKIQT